MTDPSTEPVRVTVECPARPDGGEPRRLPFRILVLGEFDPAGSARTTPIADRRTWPVDAGALEATMAQLRPRLALAVPDRLKDSPADEPALLNVQLAFGQLADFEPGRLAEQVPELKQRVRERDLLRRFRRQSMSSGDRRAALAQVVRDAARRQQLQSELAAADPIDPLAADGWIARIDQQLAAQLNEILHQPDFQALEALWRGVSVVTSRIPADRDNGVALDLLDLSKEDLRNDFLEHPADIPGSGLYAKVYAQIYGQHEAQPYGLMIGAYAFERTAADMQLLTDIGDVCRASHCPFVAAVSARFFGFARPAEITPGAWENLNERFAAPEFIPFKTFRQTEAARYIGLTFPRFLLRPPYGVGRHDRWLANFVEASAAPSAHDAFCWGNAAFAFGAAAARSFTRWGWLAELTAGRGSSIEGLPVEPDNVFRHSAWKRPVETWIPDTGGLALSQQGFIPFQSGRQPDGADFLDPPSAHQPSGSLRGMHDPASAPQQTNLANLMFLCRFAHFLKVLLRDGPVRTGTPESMQQTLAAWLRQHTIAGDEAPSSAEKPLRSYKVEVKEKQDEPGSFYLDLELTPRPMLLGAEVALSLRADVPDGQAPV